MEDCFHCSSTPEKFAPLPKEKQPYCTKCFEALFASVKVSDVSSNTAAPKAKPPPVPPKPKKPVIPYSTLPQPFQKSPSPSRLPTVLLDTNLDEPYLRPPSQTDRLSDTSSVSSTSGDSLPPPVIETNIIIPGLCKKSPDPPPLPRYSPVNYGKKVEASAAVSKLIADRVAASQPPLKPSAQANNVGRNNNTRDVTGGITGYNGSAKPDGGDNVVYKLTSLKPSVKDPWEDEMEYLNSLERIVPGKRPSVGGKPLLKCNVCEVSLADKTVESKNNRLFCTPCYRTAMADQKCVKCSLPFTPESNPVTYKNESWHQECFRCDKCKDPIGSKTFCNQKTGIFCSDCYFETSGRKCAKCAKFLKTTGLVFNNQAWHHECFVCASCQKRMGESQIFCRNNQPYCASCYDEKFGEKCAKCLKMLTGEIIEYESRQYHNDCFCCDTCVKPIGTASFFPKDGKIFCEACYTAKYAKTCKKCQSIIPPADGTGVIFKEENYHRRCFVCTDCNKSLINMGVHTSQPENQPYCRECYDARFSKTCSGCAAIISGVIGSKFMSYHGQYWHVECFNCQTCGTSLENRKFNPYDGHILCLACTKVRRQEMLGTT